MNIRVIYRTQPAVNSWGISGYRVERFSDLLYQWVSYDWRFYFTRWGAIRKMNRLQSAWAEEVIRIKGL